MLSEADPRPPFKKPLIWWEAGEPAAPPSRGKVWERGRILQMYRDTSDLKGRKIHQEDFLEGATSEIGPEK